MNGSRDRGMLLEQIHPQKYFCAYIHTYEHIHERQTELMYILRY